MDKHEKLLAAYVAAVKDVEFWRNHGTWGDGKLEIAKRERAAAKSALNGYVALLHDCLLIANSELLAADMKGATNGIY
jgi:hypothetical protein